VRLNDSVMRREGSLNETAGELAVARMVAPSSWPKRSLVDRGFWLTTPEGRRQTYRLGGLSLGECLAWAAKAPHEVPLCNGEFEFIAVKMAEVAG